MDFMGDSASSLYQEHLIQKIESVTSYKCLCGLG